MSLIKRYRIKKILQAVLWIVIGCCSTLLLIAAVKKKDDKKCAGISINIMGVSNNYFLDKIDIEKIITKHAGDQLRGKSIDIFDLKKIEGTLKRNIWIKNAEMFFDNNGILQVDIDEREPIARVFTINSSTFYLDSSLMMLPISDKFSARLPVFTGFPSEAKVLKSIDSVLLKDIKNLSAAIQNDPFLSGMIEQVDITADRTFEMIPKIGNQLIVFGDASDAPVKFRNLRLFYKNILAKTGWSKYSVINLQYKGQVVGKIRGADDISADSMRTLQLMKMIAENTEKMASDSMKSFAQDSDKNTADSTMILKSIQRDENTDVQVVQDDLIKKIKLPVRIEISGVQSKLKAELKKPISIKKKPKAVMSKKPSIKNDY